jgi:hypothetical protein
MTAQIPEVLILDGTTHPMTFCPPLPPDRRKLNFKIEHDTSTYEDTEGNACVRIVAHWRNACGVECSAEEDPVLFTPACWRKYRGTWRIRDGDFYLVALAGCVRLSSASPLLAHWFTGVLRVPLGGEILFVDMGFATVYERELHIMVERGHVKGRRIYDNRGRPHDVRQLSLANLPGRENRFPGDRDFN